MVHTLVLLRHGESAWNKLNVFTGWVDVDLTDEGRLQAQRAGAALAAHGHSFDVVYTSVLRRAIHTMWLAVDAMDMMYVQDVKSWRLNERHYGALQGLNKAETAVKHGEAQVHIWRRSFDVQPPPLDIADPRHPSNDPRYNLSSTDCPATESLKDCIHRCLPLWHETIAPAITAGKSVLISAHGNSLRGIVKLLDSISDKDIMDLEIPTGVPLVYHLNDNLQPQSHAYLCEQLLRKPTSSFGISTPQSLLLTQLVKVFTDTGITTASHVRALPPASLPSHTRETLGPAGYGVVSGSLLAPGHGLSPRTTGSASDTQLNQQLQSLLRTSELILWGVDSNLTTHSVVGHDGVAFPFCESAKQQARITAAGDAMLVLAKLAPLLRAGSHTLVVVVHADESPSAATTSDLDLGSDLSNAAVVESVRQAVGATQRAVVVELGDGWLARRAVSSVSAALTAAAADHPSALLAVAAAHPDAAVAQKAFAAASDCRGNGGEEVEPASAEDGAEVRLRGKDICTTSAATIAAAAATAAIRVTALGGASTVDAELVAQMMTCACGVPITPVPFA